MKFVLLLFILVPQITWAMPKHLEVWFLSIDRTAFIDKFDQKIKYSKSYTRQNLQCQQMGEYCFDPQVGLYKVGEGEKIQEAIDYEEVDKNESYKFIDSASSIDREMVKCDKDSSFFDVFCGKAKGQKRMNTNLEIWVDISSTMKQVDFEGYESMCKRESFLRTLNNQCPLNKKMKVYMFNESKKELGAFDQVCLNSGLNEVDRIIRDIKVSKADNLIIITDIFEAHEKLINFIEIEAHGVTRGIKKPIYAKDLKKDIERLTKMCQK